MNKTIRLISLSMLICFAFTSLVCGEDIIKSKITLTPVSPIFYENYIGIDTPTLSQDFKAHVEEASYNNEGAADVRIKDAGAFKVTAEPETEYNEGTLKSRTFSLKAPDKEGTYKMTFEGKTASGKIFNFSAEIEVADNDPFQAGVRSVFIVGVVIVVVVVAALLLQKR